MLLGLEGEFAPVAPLRHFDIAVLVLAFGHILGGEVGEARQKVGQLACERAVLLLHFRHALLDLGDFGLERFGLVRVALAHRLPDGLGGFVAAALRLLERSGHFAAARVEGEDAIRLRFGPAPGEPRIERTGIVSDEGDVVHDLGLCPLPIRFARPCGWPA